jgi:uncharacterized protein (DUF1501 family)
MKLTISRRQFLTISTGAVIGSSLLGERADAAPDVSGYKALVCIFFYGGNSGFNWVVPTSNAGYNTYKASRGNLALAQASLLALNGTASDGNSYGLHPNCPELQTMFNAGRVAILCNTGTIVQPTTAVQARGNTVTLPPQLFSHNDQQNQWMTSTPQSMDRYGWAGRIADYYAVNGLNANLSFNINVAGANYWQDGQVSAPYALGTGGAPVLGTTYYRDYRGGSRLAAMRDMVALAQADSNLMVNQFTSVQLNAEAKQNLVTSAFATAGDLTTPFPSYVGDGGLGAQLRQVARSIKARAQIGDSRQMYFVGIGGFDTHNDELAIQSSLLSIVSKNLNTFYNAMVEIGMQNSVTAFTNSDFGRTLTSNGDGSDHAWGSHHMAVGGAVQGGAFYGRMPSLALGGADDYGSGRIVPTTSTDQYAATLARWFGIPDDAMNSIFPNLKNFSSRNLGFLG